eukprot:SAG31_NODE_1370_length_8610_cov_2.897192_10_plen_155_part_01
MIGGCAVLPKRTKSMFGQFCVTPSSLGSDIGSRCAVSPPVRCPTGSGAQRALRDNRMREPAAAVGGSRQCVTTARLSELRIVARQDHARSHGVHWQDAPTKTNIAKLQDGSRCTCRARMMPRPTVLYREIETVFGLERIPVLFVQIKSVQNDCYI